MNILPRSAFLLMLAALLSGCLFNEPIFKDGLGEAVFRDGLAKADPSLAGVWACQAGKDAYIEKPISHNIYEGRQVVAAALAAAPHPDAVPYAIDPVHTRIAIAVDHAGFSKAIGTGSGTTGTLSLLPGAGL